MCERVSVRLYSSDRILLKVDDIEQTIQNTRNSAFSNSGTLAHIYASVTIHIQSVFRVLASAIPIVRMKFRSKIVHRLFLSLSVLYRCVYQIR